MGNTYSLKLLTGLCNFCQKVLAKTCQEKLYRTMQPTKPNAPKGSIILTKMNQQN